MPSPTVTVQQLAWTDPPLGSIPLPEAPLVLRRSFGSGLTRRPGDPPGRIWAVGDRGPNIKVKDARELYGAEHLAPLADVSGAKIMPRIDIGPEIAELQVLEDRVELVRIIRLSEADGRLVSGLPVPGGAHVRSEPVFDLDGNPIAPDPRGLDTEGIAALPDGGFWIGDEFGPTLVRVAADGTILRRLVPAGSPGEACLPAIAARRQINRGFEALALSADGASLFLAFQSPLAHPDEAAHEAAAHVRLWRLDAESGAVRAQFLYPLDPPETFARDCSAGEFKRKDVKVSELVCLGENALLVLERGSQTTKLYRLEIDPTLALGAEHLDVETSPTVEELSGRDERLPALPKRLLFTSDNHPEVARDLEGVAILSDSELILVSDNDFGVEGAETSFWRLRFDQPVLR
ncbi:MAG TPA: esterase-like activity of phytase family protein [Allosphingosinicella sp.]